MGAMTTEYGERVGMALRVVCKLHSDTTRFLRDFHNDRLRAGWQSLFGNTVTKELTAAIGQKPYWMAEGVYCYYVTHNMPNSVEGITVAFFDYVGKFQEPVLLAAQIEYNVPKGTQLREVCHGWDIWDLYFTWNQTWNFGTVISLGSMDGGRIKQAKVMAVPLYSIKRVEDAEELVNTLNETRQMTPLV